MEILWEQFHLRGISNKATSLTSYSRKAGTISYYKSSWEKFVTCSDQRQINPFYCTMQTNINFSGEPFEKDIRI